jgi:hypothetical protein
MFFYTTPNILVHSAPKGGGAVSGHHVGDLGRGLAKQVGLITRSAVLAKKGSGPCQKLVALMALLLHCCAISSACVKGSNTDITNGIANRLVRGKASTYKNVSYLRSK